MSLRREVLIKIIALLQRKTLIETKNRTLKCLKRHYSTVRSMKNVAVLTEDGAFALFFRPHPLGIGQLKSPQPLEFAIQGKKNVIARGGGRRGGLMHKQCVTFEEKTSGEMVISQTVSFSDVVYGFIQEDYTEFTDFPSSEDLDAFLADMELDCENILHKTSMAPADAMRSADPFELQQKVEVSRTLASNKHDIKHIAKRNDTERSKKILDLTDGDGVCAQEDSVRLQNSNSKKKLILKIDLSHTELLRNCEHLFTEPSEKSIPEKYVRRKQKSHSSVNLQSSFMNNDKSTHCRDELIKKEKVLCGLESIEESREEEVVCTRSLQHQVLNKWSHDQKIKAEIRQAASNQGNSYSSGDDMLTDSFEMMHTSPDLFSQSLSRAKVIRSDTPYLYYSPRFL